MAEPARISGRTLGHYRVLEQIAAGGMGVVYRAHDQRLERDVAVKVLPSGILTDEAARKRFRKEALAISRLNHPNVATVYDFDSQDGIDFLVMELIPGSDIDQKVATGALAEKEIVALGRQIAEGLAAAHEHGIIHRDLKPGNLRVTADGRLKILDFGLAQVTRPANLEEPTQSIATDTVSGTLPYMAPEQLAGEPPDQRSDIYAAGTVLYEMATGRRPFTDKLATKLTDAILHQPPVTPRAFNANVSPELERIILKCLEKEPSLRYHSARDLEVDLSRLVSGASTVSVPAGPEFRTRSKTLGIAVAVAIVLAAGLALLLFRGRERPAPAATGIHSLAVLPLANLSNDPAQDFFAEGMTEELTTELARISALRVISRTSTMQYKGAHKPLPQIAKELNVDAVVEGSVLRAGDRVRITAQLVRAATDTHLWADSYDRDLRDVLGLQKEVARNIAQQVQVTLTPQEKTVLAANRPVDPEVHDLYLQGLYYFGKGDERGLTQAIEFFQRAAARDPGYAPAYAGMAECYYNLSTNYWPPREAMPKAKAAALKALELDENLPEAHSALGGVHYFYDWDWAGAEQEAKRAMELSPNNATAYDVMAGYLSTVGRLEDSVSQIDRAHALNPRSVTIMVDRIVITTMARKYEQAIADGQDEIASEPNAGSLHTWLSVAYMLAGRYKEGIAEAESGYRLDNNPLHESVLAAAYAKTGKRADADKALADLNEKLKKRYSCSYEVAIAYIYLGRRDTAFQFLEKGYQDRSDCMPMLGVDPRMDQIRSDPRYQELLRRLDLAKYFSP
ncbi:MAG TPA: protein kinase [Terriglobales bacterium]|nr:protein kinase [Terriglobales bacterium]